MTEKVNGVLLTHRCITAEDHRTDICIGIMEDGHIIIRSRPQYQVCKVDLFMNKTQSFHSIMQDVRSLFMTKTDSSSSSTAIRVDPAHYMGKSNLERMLSSKDYEWKQKAVCFWP